MIHLKEVRHEGVLRAGQFLIRKSTKMNIKSILLTNYLKKNPGKIQVIGNNEMKYFLKWRKFEYFNKSIKSS